MDYISRAILDNIYDADSIWLTVILEDVDETIDFGFGITERRVRYKPYPIRTRLLGWDAPELNQAGGLEARDWLRARIPVGTEVVVQTFKNPGDKYGRWLAIIQTPELGDVGSALGAAGHAVPYDGGAR